MADNYRALELDAYVPYFLAAIGNAVSRGASRLYLSAFGVGIIDWRVLSTLAVEPGVMANRICQVVSLDKAAVSRSLRDLAKGGYVLGASGADPRRQSYMLTASGHDLHDRIMVVALQREKRLLAGLDENEIQTLLRLMRHMRANVENVNRNDYPIPPQAPPSD